MPPRRGEVWLAALDPSKGREQAGHGPVLVLSEDWFNSSGAELVTVLPITSRQHRYASRIEVTPPDGGLKKASHVIGEQVRTVSRARLTRRIGAVKPKTMAAVAAVVRDLLGL